MPRTTLRPPRGWSPPAHPPGDCGNGRCGYQRGGGWPGESMDCPSWLHCRALSCPGAVTLPGMIGGVSSSGRRSVFCDSPSLKIPTAQIALAELEATANSCEPTPALGLGTRVHAEPSQCRIRVLVLAGAAHRPCVGGGGGGHADQGARYAGPAGVGSGSPVPTCGRSSATPGSGQRRRSRRPRPPRCRSLMCL